MALNLCEDGIKASMVSARAILSAKAAWAVTKDAEVATKVRTASMMARKYRGDMGIDSKGGAEVLNPVESVGTGGTRGVKEAGSGTVIDRAVETGSWVSPVGTAWGG